MHIESNANSLLVFVESEDETDRLGRAIAEVVAPGTVIGLIGPLGAGKTRLARAIAEALGASSDAIGSPTFVLIHEYEGRFPIYHFDVYRLRSIAEFEALGPDDYFSGEGICLIEWADRVLDRLPESAWRLRIETEGPRRRMTIDIAEIAIVHALAVKLSRQEE